MSQNFFCNPFLCSNPLNFLQFSLSFYIRVDYRRSESSSIWILKYFESSSGKFHINWWNILVGVKWYCGKLGKKAFFEYFGVYLNAWISSLILYHRTVLRSIDISKILSVTSYFFFSFSWPQMSGYSAKWSHLSILTVYLILGGTSIVLENNKLFKYNSLIEPPGLSWLDCIGESFSWFAYLWACHWKKC